MVVNRLRLIGVGVVSSLLLLTTNSFAQVKWSKYSYFQNYGGLSDQLSATEIADNEASDIQNIVFDTGGSIQKRKGTKTIPNPSQKVDLSGTSVAITGLKFFRRDDGNKYIISITNSDNAVRAKKKDYVVGGGPETGAWDEIGSGALPTSGYDDDNLVAFDIAEDKVVFALDAATQVKPFVYSGSGSVGNLTSDSDCPVATILAYHRNHLLLSGNKDFPSRVYFSALSIRFSITILILIGSNSISGRLDFG